MTDMPPTPDDFYVGYLPTPASHLRTLRVVVPAALVLMAGIAALLAFAQRDPGAAEWRDGVESFTGVVRADPWPMLVTRGEPPRVILLVEQGKHGALARVAAIDGRIATATGRVLSRDGRTVLELAGSADALAAGVEPTETIRESSPATPTTLRGEIIDSKCYHGAMKPGEGKGHKACATLCISSGIPAMFLAEDGGPYLLDIDGVAGLDDDTLSKIGEPVEITGAVTVLADTRVIHAAPGSVRRTGR